MTHIRVIAEVLAAGTVFAGTAYALLFIAFVFGG
jgi:hypothetical protein